MNGINQMDHGGGESAKSSGLPPGLARFPDLVADLKALAPDGVHTCVPLSELSRWRVGGLAQVAVSPASVDQIEAVMAYVHRHQVPYVILGSSSNLLFADEGLEVLAVHLGANLAGFQTEGNRVWSGAGIWVPAFARKLALAGLTGGEHSCGIPGTLGGLICMNGGSQRKGIGDHVVDVTTVSAEGVRRVWPREACGFDYRKSVFQSRRDIIVSARFEFEPAESVSAVRRTMLDILGQRRRKFPRKMPNCGSVFVSNPAMYAEFGPPGAVIEQCGLKGMRIGGAMISPLHANFIVNHDRASARDILALISVARNSVRERTGYDMVAEVCYVSPQGRIVPAHVQADELCVTGAEEGVG